MRPRRSSWWCVAAAFAVAVLCWASTGDTLAARGPDSAPTLLAPSAELVAPAAIERGTEGPEVAVALVPPPASAARAVDRDATADWLRVAASERLLSFAPKTSPPAR